MFFIRATDPPYIRLQKLDILVGVADDTNVNPIIEELQGLVKDIHESVVEKALDSVGKVALKVRKDNFQPI